MAEEKSKLEITIVALGEVSSDECDEDENVGNKRGTVLFHEAGLTNEIPVLEEDEDETEHTAEFDGNYSAELEGKSTSVPPELEALSEILPDKSLIDDKSNKRGKVTKTSRKVKFHEEYHCHCNSRRQRQCATLRASNNRTHSVLLNKPSVSLPPPPPPPSPLLRTPIPNDPESFFNTTTTTGHRTPVKMSSINMFSNIIPSSSLTRLSDGRSFTNDTDPRNRVIPLGNKSPRSHAK